MIKEAIDRITDLVRQADGKVVEVDGVQYTTVPLHDTRQKDPEPKPFALHTLSGLVEYLNTNRDEIDEGEALVHVEGPTLVTVRSALFGHFQQRYTYAQCVPEVPGNSLGHWIDQESFVIWLQTGFAPTDDLAKVTKLAGTITEEIAQTQADDGITQKVTAKSGVSVVETLKVPNPVVLAPYRTFGEIDQPTSPFVFRVQKGPRLALFEADGGAWRVKAMQLVHGYLNAGLDGWKVIS